MARDGASRRLLFVVPWRLEEMPYGIAYLIRPAREAGYEPDGWYLDEEDGWEGRLARQLRDGRYDIVGVATGSYPVLRRVVDVCRTVRSVSPSSVLVIGGPVVTAQPTFTMHKTGADYGFVGEADHSWPLFLRAMAGSREPAEVAGIVYRARDGQLRATGRAPVVEDLGAIEPPPWDFFPLERLLLGNPGLRPRNRRAHAILASRGCPFGCNFCFHTSRYRCRPVEDIIAEIEYFHDAHRVDWFRFVDATTTANRPHFKALCRALINLPFEIEYALGTQVGCVDAELMTLLKASGCVSIAYGVESGDDRILRSVGKRTTVERINQTLELTQRAALPYLLTVMFGQLDETVESMWATMALVLARPAQIWWYVCQPLPGSRLYEIAKARGLLRDDEDFYERFERFDRVSVNLTRMTDRDLDDALGRIAFIFACQRSLRAVSPGSNRVIAAVLPALWHGAPWVSPLLRTAAGAGRKGARRMAAVWSAFGGRLRSPCVRAAESRACQGDATPQ